MRVLPARVLRDIRDALALSRMDSDLVAKIDAVLGKDRKRASSLRARTAPKKAARRAKVSAIRAAVAARADGQCENCDAYAGLALEMDHFYGGSKRRALESVETCWMLDSHCHRNKTNNYPSASYWQEKFTTHLYRVGLKW